MDFRLFYKSTESKSPFLNGYFGVGSLSWPHTETVDDVILKRIWMIEEASDDLAAAEDTLLEYLSQGMSSVALLANQEVSRPNWGFLGYDICEMPHYNWSAVEMMASYLDANQIKDWLPKLNNNGLLSNRHDAEALLSLYLRSEDPDRGYHGPTEDGIPDEEYSVCPVWKFEPPQA